MWMQVHYHEPTLLEPQAIDDRVMSLNFGVLGMAKINERVPEPDEAFQPANTNERLVIWAAYGPLNKLGDSALQKDYGEMPLV